MRKLVAALSSFCLLLFAQPVLGADTYSVAQLKNYTEYRHVIHLKESGDPSIVINGDKARADVYLYANGFYDIYKVVNGKSTFRTIAINRKDNAFKGLMTNTYYKKKFSIVPRDKNAKYTINDKTVSGTQKINKEDWYQVIAYDADGNLEDYDFCYDKTAPVVSGVKNGKTYSGKVKIKLSDRVSGIRSAVLNDMKTDSTFTVKKAGKYTLKVWDWSGNKTVVKFSIKK